MEVIDLLTSVCVKENLYKYWDSQMIDLSISSIFFCKRGAKFENYIHTANY